MRHIFFKLLFLTTLFSTAQQQENNQNHFFDNSYFSIEYNYRSYGTNDHVGNGASIEFFKNFNKWFGAGINFGYWQDSKFGWNFVNPFNGNRFLYTERIQETKFAPIAQFTPVNTKIFDFYIHTGLRLSYYNQTYYVGGYSTNFPLERFIVDLRDIGQKQIIFGYELGFGLRFKINRFQIVPSTIFANDLDGNLFNSLNLKVGWLIN